MNLLSQEQIQEIEAREQLKIKQKEEEERQRFEVEQARQEQVRQAEMERVKRLQQQAEPLYSLVQNLTPDTYLVVQYLNVNGKVAEYRFKAKADTNTGDYYIYFNSEFVPYVSNGKNSNRLLMSNILGLEVREEQLANVILIDGVAYQKMIVEPKQVDKVIPNQTVSTYKGGY